MVFDEVDVTMIQRRGMDPSIVGEHGGGQTYEGRRISLITVGRETTTRRRGDRLPGDPLSSHSPTLLHLLTFYLQYYFC